MQCAWQTLHICEFWYEFTRMLVNMHMEIVKLICFLWVNWGFGFHWQCEFWVWILVNNQNYLIFMIKLGFWFSLANSIWVFVSIGHKLIYLGLIFQIRANKLMNLEKKTWEEMRKIPHKEEVDPKVEVDGFGTDKSHLSTRVLLRPTPTALWCGGNDGLDPF